MEVDLKKAIEVLKQGGVVVFPTETAYGLAADATNEVAVERVGKIKGRVPETFPIITATREMAESVGHIPQVLRRLADQHWPGPLTLLIPAARGVLASGIVNNDQIAVRVSSHPVAQALSAGLGAPIVTMFRHNLLVVSSNRIITWMSVHSIQRFHLQRLSPWMIMDIRR